MSIYVIILLQSHLSCLTSLNPKRKQSLSLVFSPDQSLVASTAPGKGNGIGPVTQSCVRIMNQAFERCCAASLTLCLTTMSSTSGSLCPTQVSDQSLKYKDKFRYYRKTDTHTCSPLFISHQSEAAIMYVTQQVAAFTLKSAAHNVYCS